MSPAIKLEGDELMDDFPLFPGLFDTEKDNGIQEEFILDADSLALKGQVWPGMGKMDLADDDMRRTRNQKKPKCVIDRMKRASERIEPTQVIMNSELEVKRTKDVYDDASSPVPGQEDSTPPRKAPKTRRKKPTPLAEVSGNVPRRRVTTRSSKPGTGKRMGTKKQQSHQEEPETCPSPDQQKQAQDVFRDDINRLANLHILQPAVIAGKIIWGTKSRLPSFEPHFSYATIERSGISAPPSQGRHQLTPTGIIPTR
ncbi:hypothetical protein ACHAPQ_005148 [Fusarium lateritium]